MNPIIKKNAVNFGIISGLVSVAITTIIYVVDLAYFTKWWIGVISIVISLFLSIYLLIKTRKELNGDFPFKTAFTTYFIYTVIGFSIATLFNIILFNFIDPEAKEIIKEHLIKFTVDIMEKFNSPRQAIKEAVKQMKEQDQYSIGSQIQGLFTGIVISSLFGLILAAFFKSEKRQF